LSVDIKLIFLLSKQTLNVHLYINAYFSSFIDKIVMPNTMSFLDIHDIVKIEIKMHKVNKSRSQSVIILVILTNKYDNPKEYV